MLDAPGLERQLRAKWGRIPRLHGISVRPYNGKWTVFVSGPGEPPRELPSTVTVDVGGRRPALLFVYWVRVAAASPAEIPWAKGPKQMDDLNKFMWDGAPPVYDRPMDVLGHRHAPQAATQENVPQQKLDEYQLFIPFRHPDLGFWSTPYDIGGCTCFTAYGQQQEVLVQQIESSRQMTLRGISYYGNNLTVGSAVEFRVTRAGNEVARWRDLVTQPLVSSSQFAFASLPQPMPLNLIIDHDETLTVTAKALGPPPFTSTGWADIEICVLLRGWLTILNDPRAGAPRPFDYGDLNDVAQGNRDLVGEFRDGALVEAVYRVLNAGMHEVLHPETGGKR